MAAYNPVSAYPEIVTLGEPMIEFNQTDPAMPIYLQGFGGDTSNAVIAASRQGARAGFITRIGNDAFGDLFMKLWEHESVDTQGVARDYAAHTAVYFVTHGPHGHTFSYFRAGSAASRMTPHDLPVPLIQNCKWLHVSGISQAISPSACDAVFAAIHTARDAGARVSFDSNLRLKLWPLDRARAIIRETIHLSDLFLPSIEDVRELSGTEEPDAILDWCFDAGASMAVLKLGSEGALYGTTESRWRIAGHPVKAVDATGAGDCFGGAMLARLIDGDTLPEAVRYANAAAALTTTGFGAVAPIPTRQQVVAFLETANQ